MDDKILRGYALKNFSSFNLETITDQYVQDLIIRFIFDLYFQKFYNKINDGFIRIPWNETTITQECQYVIKAYIIEFLLAIYKDQKFVKQLQNEEWWNNYFKNLKKSLQNQEFAVSINNCIESTQLTSLKEHCILGALKGILTKDKGVITGRHITNLDQSNFLDCIDRDATSRGGGSRNGPITDSSPFPTGIVTVVLFLLFL